MFSGKTARLIELLSTARSAGRSVLAFKHTSDRRYSPDALATHDNRRFPAQPIADAARIESHAKAAEVIGIDEGQFFGLALVEICLRLREHGRRVIVAGIDHDTWGRDFPPLPQLKAIANNVELLHTPCRVCGSPARYSQRMIPVVDGQMVGGPEEYEPRCANCFVPLKSPHPTD